MRILRSFGIYTAPSKEIFRFIVDNIFSSIEIYVFSDSHLHKLPALWVALHHTRTAYFITLKPYKILNWIINLNLIQAISNCESDHKPHGDRLTAKTKWPAQINSDCSSKRLTQNQSNSQVSIDFKVDIKHSSWENCVLNCGEWTRV